MNKVFLFLFISLLPLTSCTAAASTTTVTSSLSPDNSPNSAGSSYEMIKLPEPQLTGVVPLEEALVQRRSVREYADSPLSLAEVSQLLWAAQGVTGNGGGRTAPSAGGLYPLEVYIVVGKVNNLDAGVYKYLPLEHALTLVREADIRQELARSAVNQVWIESGAVVFGIAAVYERTAVKYGERAERYVALEAGHAAQNLCLQATALDLGIVTVGAFYDQQVKSLLGLPSDEEPLYLIPVGRKK